MNFDWKKVLKTTAGLIVLGAITAIFSKNSNNEFDDWLEGASDDELADGYEERRQKWMNDGFGGNGERTPEMNRINDELRKRSEEKWENNPHRNTDPNYRWTDANRWDRD